MTRLKAHRHHPHPVLYGLAAVLAIALLLVVLARSYSFAPAVTLSLDEWRCSASHEEKLVFPRTTGGVQFGVNTVCDQWSRK